MKKKSFLNLIAGSLVGVGVVLTLSQTSQASWLLQSSKNRLVDSETLLAEKMVALMSGTFVAAEAPTTGKAEIIKDGDQMYLQIDSAFTTTDQAPDLQILLDTVSEPPTAYEDGETTRYLNLGGIQSVTGEQRYPIPEFVDSSQFKSVVIWCRMANATMGYASLSDSSSASLR